MTRPAAELRAQMEGGRRLDQQILASLEAIGNVE
jgi:hypothetical protein